MTREDSTTAGIAMAPGVTSPGSPSAGMEWDLIVIIIDCERDSQVS